LWIGVDVVVFSSPGFIQDKERKKEGMGRPEYSKITLILKTVKEITNNKKNYQNGLFVRILEKYEKCFQNID